jgi:5'-3' exonuclease
LGPSAKGGSVGGASPDPLCSDTDRSRSRSAAFEFEGSCSSLVTGCGECTACCVGVFGKLDDVGHSRPMRLHLIDGTYELFRSFFGAPSATSPDGREVGASRGLLRSMLALLREPEVTHVAIAFDQVIESFRNELYDGYKTGAGIEPALWEQFPIAEQISDALGLVVWPMVEFEADDALATAAARWADAEGVEQVLLCSPDKDLGQCVRGDRVVLFDRRRQELYDAARIEAKFGVVPESIPDLLALVGDAADGIPGIPRWGMKSAAAVLAHYRHVDAIPDDPAAWTVAIRGAAALADNLRARRRDATLFRTLATLRTDVPLPERELEQLRWRGAKREALTQVCEAIGDLRALERVPAWQD